MLAQADHLIELGPEGGGAGGLLVAQGTPEEVAAMPTATGVALARELAQRPAPAPVRAKGKGRAGKRKGETQPEA